MQRVFVRTGSLLMLVVLLVSSWPGQAFAADENPNGAFNVVVSPVSENLSVKPGGTVSTTIQVRNQGIATEHLKISLMRFGAEGETGTPQLYDLTQNDAFASWLKLPSSKMDIEPNIWTPVKITISPPKTAAFGYYYAVIFQRDQPSSTAPKTISQIGAAASLILLDVQAPGAVRQSNIVNFKTDRKITEFLPVKFTVRVKNSGNTHVAPRGNIFITKGGKNIALLEVNQREGNVLPNTYRVFNASWADGSPSYKVKVDAKGQPILDKQGQTQISLDWGNLTPSKLRFGKYTAKLVMIYNNGTRDVEGNATLSFWVIPWRILIVALLVFLFIAAGVWVMILRPLRRRVASGRRGGHGQRRP